ncbi:YheT family hydrolase [Legionella adelaidensis]|nr:alpha/beta fold hydrolase [Legionella adelaidensis]
MEIQFNPSLFIRNKHFQTIFSSKSAPVVGNMVKNAQYVPIKVRTHEEVHLSGYYSAQINKKPKGLVIQLHGWLGSDSSTYMIGRGESLYQKGYDVFRLNMRDHGTSLPLNKGLFHGGLLKEAFQAVKYIAETKPELPVYIIGFSMGGSFALRMAWQQSIENLTIKNLQKVISVCPSVDPAKVTDAIDKSIIYRNYFCKKWKTNLREKQRCFPELYDFSNFLTLKSCREMTVELIKKYSDYGNIDEYFADYSFSVEKLQEVRVPTIILTAADDPVIPVESFQKLKNLNPHVTIYVTEYGGHVGYVKALSGDSWLDVALPFLISAEPDATKV